MRDPRREAQALVGGGWFARVLEPSPPADVDEPWFADDPVAESSPDGLRVIGPIARHDVDVTWDEWLADRPEHRAWAADRWLGARRALRWPPPPAWTATQRTALHALAEHVVSPQRRAANGKIGLRWTLGGFGTPFFPTGAGDRQVRVDATGVVTQDGSDVTVDPLPDGVAPAAVTWLGELFGFAWSALETVRADAESVDASRVQLWPEHFDASFTCEPATYGVSPGDDDVEVAYVYVTLWDADRARDDPSLWNATHFPGAIAPVSDLRTVSAAVAWLRERRDAAGGVRRP